MAESRIEEVIVTISTAGSGQKDDPYRNVTLYFSKDGTLLFTIDRFKEEQNELILEAAKRNGVTTTRN